VALRGELLKVIFDSAHLIVSSISRNELCSPPSSPRSSPDPDLTEYLRTRVKSEYTFTTNIDDVEELWSHNVTSTDEAELVLFAGTSKTSATRKIRLASPEAAAGDVGFSVKKPRTYYFADEAADKLEEYKATAVTGPQVQKMAWVPWPGCALPWKVQKITPTGMKKTILIGHPPVMADVEERVQTKRRKGKKARIALRKKIQAAKYKQAENARLKKEMEEMVREKRTRRNREKKVKRKARGNTEEAVVAQKALEGSLHDSGICSFSEALRLPRIRDSP